MCVRIVVMYSPYTLYYAHVYEKMMYIEIYIGVLIVLVKHLLGWSVWKLGSVLVLVSFTLIKSGYNRGKMENTIGLENRSKPEVAA